MKQNSGRGKDLQKGVGGERDVMPPRIPFGKLCETLASTANTDSSVLLLYLLLHRNDLFRAFVMETRAYEKFVSLLHSSFFQCTTSLHFCYKLVCHLDIAAFHVTFAFTLPPQLRRSLLSKYL